jgi:hypothetical protein
MAITIKGAAVNAPILTNEKPRAITKYDGSHVKQKYQ